MLARLTNDFTVQARELTHHWSHKAQRLLRRNVTRARRALGHRAPRCLGVLLCYNDADFLPDAIESLLEQNHDLFVVNHGSSDATGRVLDTYRRHIVGRHFLPRTFDFYELYPWVSKQLLADFVAHYDWISWPDQDEILEGPTRQKSYYDWITEVCASPHQWLVFNNMNFWHTASDDSRIVSCTRRVRHYSLFADCAPRIRAWRARATNIREFNHNPAEGAPYPRHFNLRHYPMRSQAQMQRRIFTDRASLQRGDANYHYANMAERKNMLCIEASKLHHDDGRRELAMEASFDWRSIYGHAPPASSNEAQSAGGP